MAKDSVSKKPLDPEQATLLVLAINYVAEVEETFDDSSNGERDALITYSKKQKGQLSDLIHLRQSDLSKGDRTRIMVCITMDAHSRDIVERMIGSKIDSLDSFTWQSQLQHKYRTPPSHVRYQNRDSNHRGPNKKLPKSRSVMQCSHMTIEYIGNGTKLIITPMLMDRVNVTATQALNLNMGFAPAGPAGTGNGNDKRSCQCMGKANLCRH